MSLVDDEIRFYPTGKPYLVLKHPASVDYKDGEFDDYLIEGCYDSTGVALATGGNGSFKLYDDTAFKMVIETGTLKNGKRDDVCSGIDDKGKSHFEEKYENGKLLSGTFTSEKGEIFNYNVARSVEPAYPGGLVTFYKLLSKKIRYPGYEYTNNITGTVLLEFVVEKDGKVTDIKIINHVSNNIDREAVRVMNQSPVWSPGTMYGKNVRVKYHVPINFSL
jgi:TonB family protein